MARRHKLRAKERRRELLALLGGCCRVCGATRRLEFDCIIPQGDRHHKFDTSHRMSFYFQQHRLGNIQILCRKHNSLKSYQDRLYKRAYLLLSNLPTTGAAHHQSGRGGGLTACVQPF